MRKKKCKKILRSGCFLVACCVILAGAAAPLTAYAAEDDGSAALDVAQETRTLSGTWTFNDVLTVPDFWSSSSGFVSPLSFVVPFDFPPDLEVVPPGALSFLLFYSVQDSFAIAYGFSSDGILPLPVYSVAEGHFWNAFAVFASSLLGEDYSVMNGFGRTITLTHPQEVSVEFYDWFTANAVKQETPADNLLESIFSAIRAPLSWVGSVLGALISGPMSELLPLFAVFIAISLIFVVIVLVKKSIWGG